MPGRFYDLAISLSTATRKKGIINIIAIVDCRCQTRSFPKKIEKRTRLEHASYTVNVLKKARNTIYSGVGAI